MTKATRLCDVDGCERKHCARGLCSMHWRREYGKRTRYSITCETCGIEWMSARPSGRFCSDACKGEAYQIERRRYSRELVLASDSSWCEIPESHPVNRYARTQRQTGRWWTEIVSGPCVWCKSPFTAPSATGASYCSARCASNAGRARRGRFVIPSAVRLAIYERDGWTCQLCTEPVDPDLMTTDPLDDWAPSLDHVECQAWSLIPDHSPSNLRLAHRWCNSVRGDERWYTEGDLRMPYVA